MREALLVLLTALALTGFKYDSPAYAPPDSVQPPLSPPAEAVRVAIIGDSFTRGSDMGGNSVHGWPALVAGKLCEQGLNLDESVGAERGSGYVKRGSAGTVFADQIARVVEPDDRLVVIFGSINDGSVPTDDLSAAVRSTLSGARVAAPQAELLVIGPPWVNADPPDRILRVSSIIRSESEAVDATFVDPIAERWFVGNPELIGADRIHPNDAGHAYLADKISPLLTQQLEDSLKRSPS